MSDKKKWSSWQRVLGEVPMLDTTCPNGFVPAQVGSNVDGGRGLNWRKFTEEVYLALVKISKT